MYTHILSTLHTKPAASAAKDPFLDGIMHKIYHSLPLSIDEAIALRDTLYPGMSLEELYHDEAIESPISEADALKIMDNGSPWATFPELQEVLLAHMRNTRINFSASDRAVTMAMGYGLMLGRVIGVREERQRRKEIAGG